jgi:hypothetical protein
VIAVDPLALASVHRYFDKLAYRYGHPLYGWLGWLLSAGQAAAVPVALSLWGSEPPRRIPYATASAAVAASEPNLPEPLGVNHGLEDSRRRLHGLAMGSEHPLGVVS